MWFLFISLIIGLINYGEIISVKTHIFLILSHDFKCVICEFSLFCAEKSSKMPSILGIFNNAVFLRFSEFFHFIMPLKCNKLQKYLIMKAFAKNL